MNKFLKTKTEILDWLKVHDQSCGENQYSFKEDEKYGFTVDSTRDVLIRHHSKKLDFIPVKFGHIEGNFTVFSHPITSLEFCPSSVSANFWISRTNITSLVGATQEVGGDFLVKEGQLTTLKGSPPVIKGNFNVSNNILSSLEGGPIKVGGNYTVEKNTLTSLLGSPESIGHNFLASRNQLTNLDYICQDIGSSIFLDHNALTRLIGLPMQVNGILTLDHNKLKDLEGCPNEIVSEFGAAHFYFNNNDIIHLGYFPQKIDGTIMAHNNPELKCLDIYLLEDTPSFQTWHNIHLEHAIILERQNLESQLEGTGKDNKTGHKI